MTYIVLKCFVFYSRTLYWSLTQCIFWYCRIFKRNVSYSRKINYILQKCIILYNNTIYCNVMCWPTQPGDPRD